MIGAICYGVGERRYFDSGGDIVYSPDSHEDYESSRPSRAGEEFFYGLLAGVILLLPIVFSIFYRIRREYYDQRKLESRHYLNVWIGVSSFIACAVFFSSVQSYVSHPWSSQGFGELLLISIFVFYVLILPSAGFFGYVILIDDPWWNSFVIAAMIGTYSIYIACFYHTRYLRKQRESLIEEFIAHCPKGSEIPIHEIGLIFLLSPVTVKSVLMRLIHRGKVQCSIQNWMLTILENYGTDKGLSAVSKVRFSESTMLIDILGDVRPNAPPANDGPPSSGVLDHCNRCGNSLSGRTHCSLCGYRSSYSYYENLSPQLSPMTTWLSSRRGGIDPLGNAHMSFIIACVGFTLLLGGISYIATSSVGSPDWKVREAIILGLIGGGAFAPFLFIPIYLRIRKELLELRQFHSKDPIVIVMRTNIIASLLLLAGIFSAIIIEVGFFSTSEIIIGGVLWFYISIITGSISSLFLFESWGYQGIGVMIFVCTLLLATYVFYAGMIYAAYEKKKQLPEIQLPGRGKRNMVMIMRYLSSYRRGIRIPLHIVGRPVNMEPKPIRRLLIRMIRSGNIRGSVSEYHLEFDGFSPGIKSKL